MIDIRNRNHQEATDAMTFAAAEMKIRYNGKHKSLIMEIQDKAYIKLHHEYHLPGLKNTKLFNQRTEPFIIIERYEKLIYRLNLPRIWKIHLVIIVAMLESILKEADSYLRQREED